jgi:alkanesulfonate monooxygenase SsuD/methylene tetrahydromethanopterin reductase-like flavin-dependent oxidoreductase (luciferase family)
VEYEALGMDFHQRGRMVAEQIEVLRLLWSQEIVTYRGQHHIINEAGINPLPIHRTIPIWTGGRADITLRRTARLADGWFPLGHPDELMEQAILLIQLETVARETPNVRVRPRKLLRSW